MSEFRGTESYVLDDELAQIVNVSIALEMPLLLKGEPGTGKTQLAHAIAAGLGLELLVLNVKSSMKLVESLYHYDTLTRLNDSRFGDSGRDVSNIKHYIRMGKIGQAFTAEKRRVLLIDEIDKADTDFQDDMLDVLDQMEFDIIEIDTQEVVAAAETKWNFLPFKPGLVGGHCIGVDPYYLTFKSEALGYHPEMILAGRRINDRMGKYVAEKTVKLLIKGQRQVRGATVAVLGLTFKENVPDLRNTRVVDIIEELGDYGVDVLVHDAEADPEEARRDQERKREAARDLARDEDRRAGAKGRRRTADLALGRVDHGDAAFGQFLHRFGRDKRAGWIGGTVDENGFCFWSDLFFDIHWIKDKSTFRVHRNLHRNAADIANKIGIARIRRI